MKRINKNILLPIVAALLLIIKQLTGFEFMNLDAEAITEASLAIFTMIGIFMHPTKKDT